MKKQTRVAAYGLILNVDKVLLCRLSQAVPRSPGQWTLPGGGIDFGEHPESAVVREVFEETGLRVEVGDLKAVDSIYRDFNGTRLHSIRILYQINYLGGELIYEKEGTTDQCAWFSKEDALALPLVDLVKTGLPYIFN